MAELTEQQFENAREAYRKAYDEHPGQHPQSRDVALHAAAPFLQLPWDGPTEDEIRQACDDYDLGGDNFRSALEFLIKKFVRRRNAALQPKPLDPRIEAAQLPIAAAQRMEIAVIAKECGLSTAQVEDVIFEFCKRRNAAIQPKP